MTRETRIGIRVFFLFCVFTLVTIGVLFILKPEFIHRNAPEGLKHILERKYHPKDGANAL